MRSREYGGDVNDGVDGGGGVGGGEAGYMVGARVGLGCVAHDVGADGWIAVDLGVGGCDRGGDAGADAAAMIGAVRAREAMRATRRRPWALAAAAVIGFSLVGGPLKVSAAGWWGKPTIGPSAQGMLAWC
jgi:hypothetical protein